jgi:hypothetical protein
MTRSGTVRRRLANVLMLACLLLAGRFALATHPYQHDLAKPAPNCELCEFCQLFGDGLVQTHVSAPESVAIESIPVVYRPPDVLPRKATRYPRAPPLTLLQ